MDLVNRRCSVRQYDSRPVSRQQIDECLEAARLAPSACNSQPWQFIVVDTPQLKEKLSKAMLSGIYGLNVFIKSAPVLVVVTTEKAKWFTKVCNVLRNTKLYLLDIGIACEHFVLRAAELGIGTCMLGWFNERAVKEALGLAKTKRVEMIISLGYSNIDFQAKKKDRKSLSEMSLYM